MPKTIGMVLVAALAAAAAPVLDGTRVSVAVNEARGPAAVAADTREYGYLEGAGKRNHMFKVPDDRAHDRAEACIVSSGAARAPHRRDARRLEAWLAPAQCRSADARGLEVSPRGLLQNELV